MGETKDVNGIDLSLRIFAVRSEGVWTGMVDLTTSKSVDLSTWDAVTIPTLKCTDPDLDKVVSTLFYQVFNLTDNETI